MLVDDAWKTWRSEVAFAEQFVDETPDLDLWGRKETACVTFSCT
jgi:hypothetical protein